MRKKLFLSTVLVALGATAAAGIVFAGSTASWPGRGASAQDATTGGGSGTGCGTAYQTEDDRFFADTFAGDSDVLTAASSVTFAKKCQGGAIATFSSETAAAEEVPAGPVAQDFPADDIVMFMRATCTHPYPGVANPCHTGDVVYAAPGGYNDPVYFDLAPGIAEVQSMQFAFQSLKPGYWRIDAVPATLSADPSSWLEYRTLYFETL